MIEINVVDTQGYLGTQHIMAGVTEKYRAFFDAILDPGVHVTGASISLTTQTSSVSNPVLSDDKHSISWLVTVPTTYEVFTAALVIGLSDGQDAELHVGLHGRRADHGDVFAEPEAHDPRADGRERTHWSWRHRYEHRRDWRLGGHWPHGSLGRHWIHRRHRPAGLGWHRRAAGRDWPDWADGYDGSDWRHRLHRRGRRGRQYGCDWRHRA
jgi:hypothetical protein